MSSARELRAQQEREQRSVEALVPDPQVARRLFWGARHVAKAHWSKTPNWSLVMTLYGVGSTYAWMICGRMGVDPDAFKAPAPYDEIQQAAE